MAPPPTFSKLAAIETAIALGRIGLDLAASVPAPSAAAATCRRRCSAIVRLLADQIRDEADAAAVGARLVATLQAFARLADQDAVGEAFYDAAADAAGLAPRSTSVLLTERYRMSRRLAAGVEAALLGAAFVAEARAPIQDRSSAVAADRRIEQALTAASGRIAEALGDEAASLLRAVAQNVSKKLMEEGATVRPLVRVTTVRPYPSTALAWRLYGDPKRAEELMRRAGCATPMFMPTAFLALAP